MELKHGNINLEMLIDAAFNRTILELKHGNINLEMLIDAAFNRTILELKLVLPFGISPVASLLIEPFWN